MVVSDQTPKLELRLFGGGVVLSQGQLVPLATRKALALLAFLALEGTTTRGQLADLLWSNLDETAARSNLRKELFRLRETVLSDYLQSTGSNVGLNNFTSDVTQFMALANQNDETALEFVQGQFLAGLELSQSSAFEVWLEQRREIFQQTMARLLASRAARLEAQADLRGALKAHLALVHLDGLQEVHHRQVMRLHWLLGERAAALERFDTLERMLKTELGLKPLPESLELLAQIEKAIPETKIALPAKTQLPNLSHPPLVGRESAWLWLEAQNKSCLMIGEVGIGKTRLAQDYAQAKGGYLVVRGYASALATPFYPVAEVLRLALSQQRLDLQAMNPVWRNEIARLVPEFAEAAPNLGSSLDGRAKLIESLAQAIQAALRPNEILLLDDLHWFDPSSLELVAHLVRHGTKFLATARDLELTENKSAQELMLTLERQGLLVRLLLPSLTQSQTQILLQTLSGRNAPLFAQRLQLASGGNPLLTLETLHGLFASGALTLEADGAWVSAFDQQTSDYTELPIPQNVKELVLGRMTHLGAAVKRILEVATLCSDLFIAEDLLKPSALSEAEALTALERATAAQMIVRQDQHYRFSHDVVRRSLLEDFTPERQNLIHRRLAEQLKRSHGNPSRIAHHLEQSGRKQEAIPYLMKAAENARSLFAHQEARAIYAHALVLEPNSHQEFSIHAASADLELTLLNLDALEQHAQAMQQLSHGLPLEFAVQASLLTAKAQLYRGQFTNALETASQAFEDCQGEARVETLLLMGTALIGAGRNLEAKEKLLEGLGLQKRGVLAAELHSSLKEVYRRLGDLPLALEQAERAHGIYKALKNREQEITELAQIGQLLGLLGRSEEALERLQRATKQAREYGLERVLSVALVLLCAEQLRAGLFAEAQAPIKEGLSLTSGKMLARECQFSAMLSKVQFRTGQLGEAIKNAQMALQLSQGLGMQHTIQLLWLAEVFNALGCYDDAKVYLQQAEEILTKAQQEYWILLQILKAENALGQQQIEIAQDVLLAIVEVYKTTRLEYQVKAACVFAQLYWLQNKPNLIALEHLPETLPNWLALRVDRWRTILGIAIDAKKSLKQVSDSLESLGFLEVCEIRFSGKQKAIVQKQAQEMRLRLEQSLEMYPAWQKAFRDLPRFGTFLERQLP